MVTISCTSTSSAVSNGNSAVAKDKHNDSGIRISHASGDSSSSSSNNYEMMAASVITSSARTTSSSSSSSNHSPRLLNSIINEEMTDAIGHKNDASSSQTSNFTDSVTVSESKSDKANDLAGSSVAFKSKRQIKKRYCFPTLKSFSYYYNNRYYHQCKTKGNWKKYGILMMN